VTERLSWRAGDAAYIPWYLQHLTIVFTSEPLCGGVVKVVRYFGPEVDHSGVFAANYNHNLATIGTLERIAAKLALVI
jgi:hypothetical protein